MILESFITYVWCIANHAKIFAESNVLLKILIRDVLVSLQKNRDRSWKSFFVVFPKYLFNYFTLYINSSDFTQYREQQEAKKVMILKRWNFNCFSFHTRKTVDTRAFGKMLDKLLVELTIYDDSVYLNYVLLDAAFERK